MHQLGILGSHQHRCGDRSKLFGADGVAIEPYEPAARCESDLHDAAAVGVAEAAGDERLVFTEPDGISDASERKRSEEHTSELQSRGHLVCRLLLEKKKKSIIVMEFNEYITNIKLVLI